MAQPDASIAPNSGATVSGNTTAAHLNALAQAEAQINEIILGKSAEIRLALTCLLAGGHLLLEDLPGVGKTTLARALAVTLGLSSQRIQFTSDLLPSDLTGVSVYQRDSGRFEFQPGPIFTHLVLADEINRGTPKTQSALLEAMAESQVTVDGVSHRLPQPFFVIATQNPVEQSGTFELPESQLDRFLMSIRLGYPSAAAEKALLAAPERRELLEQRSALLSREQLLEAQQAAQQLRANDALLDYVIALTSATRSDPRVRVGLSPRGARGLLQAARCHASLALRKFTLPEDVQGVFVAVARHRLILAPECRESAAQVAQMIMESVPAI
ncbi:MAG: AAA family ATPase [Xanthomonadales bacterium]|nr:AAA family ATPase [Xanthomonadales bacterium]